MAKFVVNIIILIVLTFVPSRSMAQWRFDITELDDVVYPDNPDIGFRSQDYAHTYFADGEIVKNIAQADDYKLILRTDDHQDIQIDHLDLKTWLPTTPDYLVEDKYLSLLAIINQEWNRNQVSFKVGEFTSQDPRIVRVDLARNCLQSYLWEIIVFVQEDGKTLPFAHGWFSFPKNLYQTLFNEVNPSNFVSYARYLEQWTTPPSKKININKLRKEVKKVKCTFKDVSDQMYLLVGERAKKRKEIIQPATFETMADLQSDQTTFATFSPPGIYERSNPRITQLGRLQKLDAVHLIKTSHRHHTKPCHELQLHFENIDNRQKINFIVGGLDFGAIPVLSSKDVHKGWQCSMGFGNHTFYENHQEHQSVDPKTNPYYAYLSDNNGWWLDSHAVGIDGPLMYFENEQKTILHLCLLSFERHAIVGEYVVYLSR